MKLTPLDIRHKEFGRSMRGYKDMEVDEFLDDIADEFERFFNENIDYKEKVESMEEKVEQYRNIEETLKKTLISAQQQAEEMKQNAKKEADLILRDAELKSRSILNDSYAERQKIQRSVQALKQKQEDLRYQMRSILETYMNVLDQDGDLAGEDLFEGVEAAEAKLAATAAVLPDGGEAAIAATGIDEAVSNELLDDEAKPAAPEASAEDITVPKADMDKEPVRTRPLDQAVMSSSEDDDPFADVEINSDDSNFKW